MSLSYFQICFTVELEVAPQTSAVPPQSVYLNAKFKIPSSSTYTEKTLVFKCVKYLPKENEISILS